MSSESRRSELNPIRSASVSVRIVGSALHTTHSHHLSKSGLRSAGAAFADSPQVYPPLAARSRDKARRANEFALFPPNRPSSEATLKVDRSLRSVTGGSYGDSKSLRRPGTAPATLPHASGPTRSRQPRIDSKHGSVPLPYLSARQQDPAGRSGWGDRNSNRPPRPTQ